MGKKDGLESKQIICKINSKNKIINTKIESTSMDKLFNWGIIGPGRIAHRFMEGLAVIKDASLYAVASTSEERAQSFAGQYHAQKAYASYAELVNDPRVDAVYIATPHCFHFENAMLCLNSGKPVLCEKPLTVNARESRKLFETTRDNSVFLMEALWSRFVPAYQQVREWLDQQVIGEIKLLTSTMGYKKPMDAQSRLFNPALAGGVLLDFGSYPIAISQWILGENPISFIAKSHFSDTHVDDLTCVDLQYKNGAVSQFSCNFLTDNLNDLFIYGTEGYIRLHPKYWQSRQVTLATHEKELTITRPFRGSGFEFEMEEVMHCVRNGKIESPIMPHAQTQANMELMDSIRREIGLSYPFEHVSIE
jgi:predicted dehydrogenase